MRRRLLRTFRGRFPARRPFRAPRPCIASPRAVRPASFARRPASSGPAGPPGLRAAAPRVPPGTLLSLDLVAEIAQALFVGDRPAPGTAWRGLGSRRRLPSSVMAAERTEPEGPRDVTQVGGGVAAPGSGRPHPGSARPGSPRRASRGRAGYDNGSASHGSGLSLEKTAVHVSPPQDEIRHAISSESRRRRAARGSLGRRHGPHREAAVGRGGLGGTRWARWPRWPRWPRWARARWLGLGGSVASVASVGSVYVILMALGWFGTG